MTRSAARAQYRLRRATSHATRGSAPVCVRPAVPMSDVVNRAASREEHDVHHFTTRSSSATYAYSIATAAAVTAIHARTSRTRANAPAYCSASPSRVLSAPARACVVAGRAPLVVAVRFRDVFVTRVIAHLSPLMVHVLALV